MRDLIAGIDIQHTRQKRWLIGHHAHHITIHPCKPHHRVAGKIGLHLEERPQVHHRLDDLLHIIGLIFRGGHQMSQGFLLPIGMVLGHRMRWVFGIILGQIADKQAHHLQRMAFMFRQEMGNPAAHIVDHRAA